MTPLALFLCDKCKGSIEVEASMGGQSVDCPHCGGLTPLVAATPIETGRTSAARIRVTTPATAQAKQTVIEPRQRPVFRVPSSLPFFASGRRKILQAWLDELLLANSQILDDEGAASLRAAAVALKLEEKEAVNLRVENFKSRFESIKKRCQATFVLTDDDLEEIEQLKRKYKISSVELDGYADLFRAIFLLESSGKLPPPLDVGMMLNDGEVCYYSIGTTWHQARVRTHGYAGTSISLPSGIKGVRFKLGRFTPIRSEQMTPLSSGELFVTTDRLFFNGTTRNVSIPLKKIVDGEVFVDALKIEKATGKDDMFSMSPPEARYILSLIGVLR